MLECFPLSLSLLNIHRSILSNLCLSHYPPFVLHSRHSSDRNYIKNMIAVCSTQVARNIFHELSICFDYEWSRSENTLTIREGYDQELDRLRFAVFVFYAISSVL